MHQTICRGQNWQRPGETEVDHLPDDKVLADLVRTDRHNHRQVSGNSELIEGVKILARAHQNAIWAASDR
jgi:hypothetical protein